MFNKLAFIEERYEELSQKISDPEVIADQNRWRKLCKENSDITPIVEKYREYKKAKTAIEEAKEMLQDNPDKDFEEMLELEIEENKEKIISLEEELKILLLPKDPNDEKSVIVEIRGGTGGEEAALFAGALFRMYSMYAENRNWKIDIMNSNPTELGGTRKLPLQLRAQVHTAV